ncbi:MAG: hypothetical protein QN131_00375 [Armatimonadota bacterium]|nr:hypothetical protein [Armatimonadota bacterium]MDR7548380.1 hypothetical protein [Armatimonadota bacterium]
MSPGRQSIQTVVGIFLAVALAAGPSSSASFAVEPGKRIGPVAIGMTEHEVLNAVGGRMRPAQGPAREVLEIPAHGLTVWLSTERVIRIRTTNAAHKTQSGYGPGDENWTRARQALCNGGVSEASAVHMTAAGFEVRCPFAGLVLEVSRDRIVGLVVLPSERLR